MDIQKIKEWVNKNPMAAYPAFAVLAFLLVSLLLTPSSRQKAMEQRMGQQAERIGLEVGGLDDKAALTRIEKNYYELDDRLKSMEKGFKAMGRLAEELQKSQKKVAREFEAVNKKIDSRLDDLPQESESHLKPEQEMQLLVADINPIESPREADTVYLPLGSFCKGTLLTGVYATADQNNPLPVLISLDEAFWAPNQARIPLKGAFVLGKAYGDLVSSRALIQIIAISSVLPDGVTFEKEQDLGYVTDAFGELGIRGEIIRNTGQQLATTFVSGFMAGGSQALADQEVTTRVDDHGDTVKQFTGNSTKNAVFQGLAQSAGKLSDYYARQTENLVPAIHVSNGQQVYFILQKGVSIHGLSRLRLASGRLSD